MSTVTKTVFTLAALVVLTACGNPRQEDVVVVEPTPIPAEPVSTKF